MNSNRDKLLSDYSSLPEINRLILLIYSVLYREATQKTVIECLNSKDFCSLGYAAVYGKTFTGYIKTLADLSLLVLDNGKSNICNPEISEIIIRNSIHDGKLKTIFRIVEDVTVKQAAQNYGVPYGVMFRLARIALYRGDKEFFNVIKTIQANMYYRSNREYPPVQEILSLLITPFDPEFIKGFNFNDNHFDILFSGFIMDSFVNSAINPEITEFLVEDCRSEKPKSGPSLMAFVCEHLLLQGRMAEREEIEKLHPEMAAEFHYSTNGILDFFQGNMEGAFANFDLAISQAKKNTKKRNYVFASYTGVLYFFTLLHNGENDNYKKALDYSRRVLADSSHPFYLSFSLLHNLCVYISGLETDKILMPGMVPEVNYWNIIIYAFVLLWVKPENAAGPLPAVKKMLKLSEKAGYKWIEMQLNNLLDIVENNEKNKARAHELKSELNGFFITELIRRKENWEIALNALGSITSKPSAETRAAEKNKRLVWFIGFDKSLAYCRHIQPVEQSYNAKKGWSSGRNISLKRLASDWSKIDYLTEQDRSVVPHIDVYSYGYYGESEYAIDPSAIVELAGHPLLFDMETEVSLEIISAEPELRITEADSNTLKISFYPDDIDENEKFKLEPETPLKFKLYKLTSQHKKIVKILGRSGLVVPENQKERVLDVITSLSGSISIHSDISGDGSRAEFVEPLAVPHVLVLPYGEGLKFAAFCRPFAGDGPYYRPGKGGRNVIADVKGKKLRTTRDITLEEKEITELLEICPTLQTRMADSDLDWILEETDTCLQALVELQDAGDKAIIEWPEGERLRVRGRAGISNFNMNIRKENDWFSLSGELDLENGEVMEMRQLLELFEQSPGRFIRMNDGSFVALTEKFRKQLDDLRSYSELTKSGLRFSPLAASFIDEMAVQAASLKADMEWKEHLKRLEDLKNFKPELPRTLQAELRDYQLEGFEWLARLSHWGVGACLADDMGLGKTIQALSILLTRASDGPSLVVAPASVCINWHSEIARFAPTLNAFQYAGKDRDSILGGLGPFDILICSYGMIQQDGVAEALKEIRWQMVVLDEAQSVKNMATKRSQAVMSLSAGFRLITTGTPVENHLGELWNLFRFLNPGLLGSLESFNRKFAIPIEKNNDRGARQRLKKLISPFLLRRMKSEVLDELPEKTDITLHVELSGKEKAFYEALRLNAIEKISGDKGINPGQRHLQILAEIMKLRRACCNARLVEKSIDFPSSKFAAFTEIVDELIENRHKALVFSQFVDHLSILKGYLEARNIPFQYLDGSTPMKERKAAMDGFQSGNGEIFLISLKAGGFGLNLTAADYVIHMDPWWNPAVEDQASDRAHRIGQQRPVTVYRLVAKDTIEEKIVDLHKHKRDLANSLLEDSDMSGKISADELLALISGD